MGWITEAELIEIEGRARALIDAGTDLRMDIRAAHAEGLSRDEITEIVQEHDVRMEAIHTDIVRLVGLAREGGARPMGEPYSLRQDGVA